MAEKRIRVPHKAAIRIWPFIFDKTAPAESSCAAYILQAPQGKRMARMRRLILLGHETLRERHRPIKNSDNEG